MSWNIREIFNTGYLKEYLARNKNFLIAGTLLFILSALIGVIFSDSFKVMVNEILKQIIRQMPNNPTAFNEFVFIFSNNIRANLIILSGGLVFSAISVMAIILNAIVIGYTFTLVPPVTFMVGIIPHGILELPATILSLVGALLITKLEVNAASSLLTSKFSEEKNEFKILIKDIILTMTMVFVMLLVAAFIESYITPTLLNMVI